jgi:tetratricopeptide (TPR) repeat protein
MKCFCWLGILGVSLTLVGCATTPHTPPKPLTGDPLIDGREAMENGPPKDKVLWQYRTALTAMQRGQFEEARRLLDDALDRIGNIIGKDETARKARGLFSPEAKKTFIGEPYERVMAYYYRGLLYWMDGEPDNARACFRSAQFEDSDTTNKEYSSDYVLLDYLDGFATTKLNGDGSDALKSAQSLAKISSPPPYNPKANVLFFVDFGPGPTKYATGEYAQHLMFREGTTPIRAVQIQVDQKNYQLRPFDDLNFQATTRGGRVMDQILANKASFKRATDVIGDAAIVSGAVVGGTSRHQDGQLAGLGLVTFGLLNKITSASTSPEADVRSWDNLPLYLSFAAMELSPGQHAATIDFLDDANRILPGLTKKVTFTVPDGSHEKVIYVSDKSTTPQTL